MKKHTLPLIFAMCLMHVVAITQQEDSNELHHFKAPNGIRFEYGLLLPSDFDRSKDYEIVAVLTEVSSSDNAWSKSMQKLEAIDLQRTILIVPKVPVGKTHWATHPIHHAFNDLLKSVRKSHGKRNQKFHLIGLEAGHETAFWWTYGASALIASTSIINGHLWKEKRWDRKWYNNLIGSHVPIFAYENKTDYKFSMPGFTFSELKSIAQVIKDIEDRQSS